ncbi:alpha/beta hydrolase [Fibrobacter sp. UBA2449]|uniref:poly(ethylene terephthalate) hydrolase family protein n=1 Tax=Fibrobacter sp. UBA2449 TaxID=1946529 RepID=UPI0025C03685|nr:alpha/beta hydrolase [Fibrobacter sp. UBA2449]
MKSRFFRNLAKGLVVASAAFAVVNCDDSALTNAPQYDPNDPLAALSSSGMVDPSQMGDGTVTPGGDDACLASSLPDACGPGTNPVVNPTSSADVNPTSSEMVAPASSESVSAESSSSEAAPVVSSSSEEAKPAVPKIFLANDKEEEKNYMEVEYKTNTGWDGEGILAYPKRLTDNPDQKHAVVVWGPGGGTKPSAYEGMIRRLASHGFVVIALKESPGNATQAIKALDWLDGLNKDSNSPLFGKLDMNTVGCSGHSMGGLESEQALIKDRRVLTAFLNNSGDWGGAGAMKVATDRTIAILYGEGGMERGNAENDYNNANVKAPACLIQMTGGKGTECYEVAPGRRECGYGHGSGSWDGMAATVAWMRWHLGGEEWRKADFVGTSGKYIDGNIAGHDGKWKGQCKNF